MRGLTRTLFVGVVVLAMMALVAAPAGAKKGGTDRPFKASGSGSIDVPLETCTADPSFTVFDCTMYIDTTLRGTHLGKATSDGEGPTHIDYNDWCVLPGDVIGGTYLNDIGSVITAANGDELYVRGVAEGCFAYGVDVVDTSPFTIDGGTGRFENAEGSGILETAIAARAPGEVGEISRTMTGTISY